MRASAKVTVRGSVNTGSSLEKRFSENPFVPWESAGKRGSRRDIGDARKSTEEGGVSKQVGEALAEGGSKRSRESGESPGKAQVGGNSKKC